MKRKINIPQLAAGLALTVAGLIIMICTRTAGIAEDASGGAKAVYALSLIAIIIGAVVLISSLVPRQKKVDIRTLTMAALMAALCYIGFALFKIDIPVGTEKTAFHLGNVFCVLAALLIGGLWGGLAGAVGMTIGDLLTGYVTSAPKTFFLKLCIGLIVGLFAHRIFHINEEKDPKKLTWKTIVSCTAGMAFNVIFDPLVGYFYKLYLFGIPQDMAKTLAKISAATTLVNALVAVVAAVIFYLVLRPALRKAGLLKNTVNTTTK